MDIEILPKKYSNADFLSGAMAIEGTTDFYGVGTLTTVEMMMPVEFQCFWEPYITSEGLIIVYFAFPNNSSYLVFGVEDFMDRIEVV